MQGEKIYEYDAEMTSQVDFGIELAAILDGSRAIPLQGARFNAGFEGRAAGRLAGRVSGVDYAFMRPDGVLELNIHGVFETPDGARIALHAGGVGILRANEPMIDLSENVSLMTASADYTWVNGRQIWAVGVVDLAAGKLHLEGYLQ
ncbi:DUF3237 domain-containing protein [Phenylobacterium sp. LH3H17]|uniref:DUF3237 family protein n=1 Tax=Phenylobacterium sp. LH3H17 TaxID=2903901 RepID=UPI0020CA07AB|nr:DUF3237 family protein [Phenylobacterium sp. LH3H17]UTP38189.1 DUF3237 domain-containing protein [Phenylobacterium sp. LH3H17]